MTDSLQATSATYSLASGTSEATVFTYTPTANNVVEGIWLDLTNLTQNTTIRVKYQIDGSTARTFQTVNWTTGMDDGVFVEGRLPVVASQALSVTIQSSVAEGASRDIPYSYLRSYVGAGAISWTYTLTDSGSGLPIGDATIWITTDTDGNNTIWSGTTDASGQITAYLDAGTYQIWRQKSGYSFVNPDAEVVS